MNAEPAKAKRVPLKELLKKIPEEYVAKWDNPGPLNCYTSAPVGRYAHEASNEIERLETVNAEILDALKLMLERFADSAGYFGDFKSDAVKSAEAAIAKAEG